MKKTALSLAFLLVFLFPTHRAIAQASTQDSLALVDLYNNTNGPNWVNHTNWLTGAPLSTWYGIYIFDSVHVSIVNLDNNNLVGTLPSSLGNLTNPAEFSFQNNRLSGSLPSSLTNLPGTRSSIILKFAHNQMSGAIPDFEQFWPPALDVSFNDFTFATLEPFITSGQINDHPRSITDIFQADLPLIQNGNVISIAAGGTLSNNTYTWYKDGVVVATNSGDSTFTMTGTGAYAVSVTNAAVPSLTLYSIQSMNTQDSLAVIDLYNNTLGANWLNNFNWATSAPVASWNGIVARFGRVQQIYLPFNNLNGPLPSSLSNLSAATLLDLDNNQLSGTIPSSFGSLQSMQQLQLATNQLTGSVPPTLGDLSNLSLLDLSANQLTGPIPTTLGSLTSLGGLTLSSNRLTGAIPVELGNLTNLIALDLNDNQLTDTIPASLGNMPVLEQFHLDANQLTGQIPPALGRLKNLIALGLDSNQISGQIPDSICQITRLAHLLLYNNKLTGPIPDSLGNDTQLIDIQLQNNNLSGSVNANLAQLDLDLFNVAGNDYNFSLLPISLPSYTTFTYAPPTKHPTHPHRRQTIRLSRRQLRPQHLFTFQRRCLHRHPNG